MANLAPSRNSSAIFFFLIVSPSFLEITMDIRVNGIAMRNKKLINIVISKLRTCINNPASAGPMSLAELKLIPWTAIAFAKLFLSIILGTRVIRVVRSADVKMPIIRAIKLKLYIFNRLK